MELVGNESRIRALFLELKQTEELATPRFARVWQRAQTKRDVSPVTESPRVTAPLAAATACLVAVGCALAFLIWSSNVGREQHLMMNPALGWSSAAFLSLASGSQSVPDVPVKKKQNHLRPRRNRHMISAHRPPANDPQPQLSKAPVWQSPTTMLLESPADDLLLLTPQLSQAAVELKSFLPTTER